MLARLARALSISHEGLHKVEAEMKSGARLLIISKQVESDYFDPWIVPYKSVEQAHSKWNLDCFLYVHK